MKNVRFAILITIGLITVTKVPAQQGKRSVYIASLLPASYVKDASADYTKILQDALNKYDTVHFPNFPLKVSKDGLTLKSNQVLYFPKGSVLRIAPNANTNYEILRIHEVSNVKVFNPTIIGDRFEHLDTKGEWGMGISIRNSKNIQIINPVISKCWGDGIYMGALSTSQAYNENVLVSGAKCDANRRNGLSIIEGKNITVKNSTFSNSMLVGLDIEPNHTGNLLENILIDNVTTRNSALYGIQISVGLLNEHSKNDIRHGEDHDVTVIVKNHKDYNSNISMHIISLAVRNIEMRKNKGLITGKLQIINPEWKPKKLAFLSDKYENFAPEVDIKLKTADKAKAKSKSFQYNNKPGSGKNIRIN